MKKILILLICVFVITVPSFAKNPQNISKCGTCSLTKSDDIGLYKSYAEQIRKDRAVVSNALQLSEEQAKCLFDINQETNKILDEQFQTLYGENLKLKSLKSNLADSKEIRKQEKAINKAKQNINKTIEDENKKIKKILNGEQKAKLRMIQKLQKKSVKSSKKQKNYYKSNPKMRPFAPHIQCN